MGTGVGDGVRTPGRATQLSAQDSRVPDTPRQSSRICFFEASGFSGIFVGRRGAAQMLDLVSEKWEPRLALPLARDALGDARGREHASVTKAPVMT